LKRNILFHIYIVTSNIYDVKKNLAYFDNRANSGEAVTDNADGNPEPSQEKSWKVQRLYTRPEREEIVRTDMKVSELTRNVLALA